MSPHSDAETVKILLQYKANTKVNERDTGNNLNHLAALYSTKNDIFSYIVKNVDLEFFARNRAGETVSSIVMAGEDKERFQIVQEMEALRDKSKIEAQ